MDYYEYGDKKVKVYKSKIRSVLGHNIDIYEMMEVPGLKSILKLFEIFGRMKEEDAESYAKDPMFQQAVSAAMMYVALWNDYAKWFCYHKEAK